MLICLKFHQTKKLQTTHKPVYCRLSYTNWPYRCQFTKSYTNCRCSRVTIKSTRIKQKKLTKQRYQIPAVKSTMDSSGVSFKGPTVKRRHCKSYLPDAAKNTSIAFGKWAFPLRNGFFSSGRHHRKWCYWYHQRKNSLSVRPILNNKFFSSGRHQHKQSCYRLARELCKID